MFDFFRSLFRTAPPSGETAKERLKLVLLSDHLSLAPDVVDSLKRDLMEVISRYVEIDTDHSEVTFEHREHEIAMLANIPITAVRDRPLARAVAPAEIHELTAPSSATPVEPFFTDEPTADEATEAQPEAVPVHGVGAASDASRNAVFEPARNDISESAPEMIEAEARDVAFEPAGDARDPVPGTEAERAARAASEAESGTLALDPPAVSLPVDLAQQPAQQRAANGAVPRRRRRKKYANGTMPPPRVQVPAPPRSSAAP